MLQPLIKISITYYYVIEIEQLKLYHSQTTNTADGIRGLFSCLLPSFSILIKLKNFLNKY